MELFILYLHIYIFIRFCESTLALGGKGASVSCNSFFFNVEEIVRGEGMRLILFLVYWTGTICVREFSTFFFQGVTKWCF